MDRFKFTRQYGRQQLARAERRLRTNASRLRRDCKKRGYHSFIQFAGSNVRACSWCGTKENEAKAKP